MNFDAGHFLVRSCWEPIIPYTHIFISLDKVGCGIKHIIFFPGIQSTKVTRSIPNYLIRVVPPLAIYNRLPYATEISCESAAWSMRIEAGERTHTYTLQLTQSHRITIEMYYMGMPWHGSFSLSPGKILLRLSNL